MSDVIGHLLAMQERLVKLEAEVEALKARPASQPSADLPLRVRSRINALGMFNSDLKRHLVSVAVALLARGLPEEDVMDRLDKGSR